MTAWAESSVIDMDTLLTEKAPVNSAESKRCPAESKKQKYLFVCTGNTCRSPMAAALFNHMFSDENLSADSCGIMAFGEPISENAASVLAEKGVLPTPHNNYPGHVSKNVTEELVADSDVVIGLTSRHAVALISYFPAYASKITVMPKEIFDPYGGNLDDYRKCLEDIEEALKILKFQDNSDE